MTTSEPGFIGNKMAIIRISNGTRMVRDIRRISVVVLALDLIEDVILRASG
jgi:hypothetical protein